MRDNGHVGRLRAIYDALVYRRAAGANEEIQVIGSKFDSRLSEILDLTDADYILVNRDDVVTTCSIAMSNIGLVKNNGVTSEAVR